MYDIVLRLVPHYGWLYLIVRNGVELSRGEFEAHASDALARAQVNAERLIKRNML